MRYYFSLFLTACVTLLILAGGLVTSHQAGLAVPDWPLSYGQLMPPMVGNIFWEHGHRMIAGFVGIITLILAVWTQFAEKRTWFKKLAWASVGTVVLQALLGGLTVLLLLPPAVSIFHACLAQTFYCLTVFMAYGQSRMFEVPLVCDPQVRPKLKRLSLITLSMVFIQLILGAAERHTHQAIQAHVIFAILVLLHLYLMVSLELYEAGQDPLIPKIAMALAVLGLVQLSLGVGSVIHTRFLHLGYAPTVDRVMFTAAHQTTGAIILALNFLNVLRIWKK